MTDAQGGNAIVWFVGSNNQLYAVDGDTGASVLTGAAITLGTVKPHQTPMIANGRVFVGSDARIFALTP
jgi:outer membrane protein assembly factor BamB